LTLESRLDTGYLREEVRIESNSLNFLYGEISARRRVFFFAVGEDPTYRVIEDGAWLNDRPYGVIHRIAGDGSIRGILTRAVEFAGARFDYLRIDTHEKNIPMQNALKKQNFTQRGVIYLRDGNPRLAYDKLLKMEKENTI